RRRPGRWHGSGPRSVLDRVEWPGAFQPCQHRVVQDRVERGAVGAHPGSDRRVRWALGAAARPLAVGRVDVNAADDVAGVGAEHGVGEPAARGEVLCVLLQVALVVIQGHLVRPAAPAEARRRPDVVDAGRPGGVIGLVVLRPERGQPELRGYEPVRYREVFRDEQLLAHQAMITRLTDKAPPAGGAIRVLLLAITKAGPETATVNSHSYRCCGTRAESMSVASCDQRRVATHDPSRRYARW